MSKQFSLMDGGGAPIGTIVDGTDEVVRVWIEAHSALVTFDRNGPVETTDTIYYAQCDEGLKPYKHVSEDSLYDEFDVIDGKVYKFSPTNRESILIGLMKSANGPKATHGKVSHTLSPGEHVFDVQDYPLPLRAQ